jgi:hypothetical protein
MVVLMLSENDNIFIYRPNIPPIKAIKHLASAPLIIHPIFGMLGVLDGGESISTLMIVIALYTQHNFQCININIYSYMTYFLTMLTK